MCQRQGRWLSYFSTVYVSLDNHKGTKPKQMVWILGSSGSLHSSISCGDDCAFKTAAHLEEIWAPEFKAGRRGSGVEDQVWQPQWHFQPGGDTVGAHLHFTKTYEAISLDLVHECMSKAGVPESLVELVSSQYRAPHSIKLG